MTTENKIDTYRRNFVGGAAALAAGVTIAPGVLLSGVAQAKPADMAVNDTVRWGMLVNANKCDDCGACVSACNEEHGLVGHGRPETDAQWIRTVKLRDKTTGHVQTLPVMCQHCETAPCADVCPTGASFRRADGIVLVDKHICIGCRYCMMACPYKARSFVHEKLTDQRPYSPRGMGTVESCTMCVHRVDNDEQPACVVACAGEHAEDSAIIFGDINDPNSEISQQMMKHGGKQIRADLGLNTGVRYQGL
jgi:tetrathionate reductase subunit B